MYDLELLGKRAKLTSKKLASMSSGQKEALLSNIAISLEKSASRIIEANKLDLEAAEAKGTSKAILDRLMLNEKRIIAMAEGLREIITLRDPVGEVISGWKRPNGLDISQVRVPMGVIGIIYEARPNVTVDAAGLCLKTGNAVILRGGSEAINSNKAVVSVIKEAISEIYNDENIINCVQLVEDTSRETAVQLMKLNKYVDLLIPRGGAGLIKSVVENSTVPVIETGVGNCHVFVDESADIKMATEIIVNAKSSRPAVCNAAETLLVHKKIASDFLPAAVKALREKGVEVRGCLATKDIINDVTLATEEDYAIEFLDYILAVKIVDSLEEAIEHIEHYGTKHSEAIVTKNYDNSERFLKEIDAAAVYVNSSTRFTDGGEFGFGAEIGISTQKLHARGPMGLKELTTIKYQIRGNGQIR